MYTVANSVTYPVLFLLVKDFVTHSLIHHGNLTVTSYLCVYITRSYFNFHNYPLFYENNIHQQIILLVYFLTSIFTKKFNN